MSEDRHYMKKCPRKNKFLFSWTDGGQKRNANFNKTLYNNKLGKSTNYCIENQNYGRRCFLGMLDPSARPLVPENELTFTIPMSRFKEMLDTMNDSALYQKAFSALKRRINK